MREDKIKALIETHLKDFDLLRKISTIIYKMEFGEIIIQYDCSLN